MLDVSIWGVLWEVRLEFFWILEFRISFVVFFVKGIFLLVVVVKNEILVMWWY